MSYLDTYTVFIEHDLFCQGSLTDVITQVKRKSDRSPQCNFLIFSDETGKSMDFNLQGSEAEVLKRLEVYIDTAEPKEHSGPGRPKLGVASREVSLLPRHWEWLATQPGGASATLRQLVEDARKKSLGGADLKKTQERTYRFMSVIAGDFEGYEEALRALYRKDKKAFQALIHEWPQDVRNHIVELAKPIFAD